MAMSSMKKTNRRGGGALTTLVVSPVASEMP
jgi:hypothetical protein